MRAGFLILGAPARRVFLIPRTVTPSGDQSPRPDAQHDQDRHHRRRAYPENRIWPNRCRRGRAGGDALTLPRLRACHTSSARLTGRWNFGLMRRQRIAVAERDGEHVPTAGRRRRTRKPSSSNEPIPAFRPCGATAGRSQLRIFVYAVLDAVKEREKTADNDKALMMRDQVRSAPAFDPVAMADEIMQEQCTAASCSPESRRSWVPATRLRRANSPSPINASS
jgi:hypothetical protein